MFLLGGGHWEVEWMIRRKDIFHFSIIDTKITLHEQQTNVPRPSRDKQRPRDKNKPPYTPRPHTFVAALTTEEASSIAIHIFGLLKLLPSAFEQKNQDQPGLLTDSGSPVSPKEDFGQVSGSDVEANEDEIIQKRKEKQKRNKRGKSKKTTVDDKTTLLPQENGSKKDKKTCCKCCSVQ